MPASLGGNIAAPGNRVVDALHQAMELMREHNWSGAIEVLNGEPSTDHAVVCHRRLCQNLSALEQHRPALLAKVLGSPRTTSCEVVPTSSGLLTISQKTPGREAMILTPGGEPAGALAALWPIVQKEASRFRTLALCGVGDGYVLTKLAMEGAPSSLGMEGVVHVIEPHTEVLWHAFMIHDWSGFDGPIAQKRFHWWLGPEWPVDLECAFRENLEIPLPEVPVRNGIEQDAIDAQMRATIDSIRSLEKRWTRRVAGLYENHDTEALVRLLRGDGDRPSRLLMLTTRFSTVLQHSARDLCTALESIGWRTRMTIEKSGYARNTQRRLLREILDFEPDLVMQIDHLRHEHGDVFPDQLPFVCWIQDDLPNLTRRSAGARIGPRDFVLTASQNVYVSDYGYPDRQCIHFTKQTPWNDTPVPTMEEQDWLHDISFVSNASQHPADLLDALPSEMSRDKSLQRIIRAVCQRIMDMYDRGDDLFAVGEVRRMIDEETAAAVPIKEDVSLPMAIRIFASLNNALYRQKALGWVAQVADKRGWNFGLYGNGWEEHPDFSRFARGSIAYGDDLADLTRRTKVNLQIVPYSCIHQRLLDGVSAGGFFLIREHPMDMLAPEFHQRASRLLGKSINNATQWRESLDATHRSWLDDWMARRDRYVDHRGIDPVARYREIMDQNRGFTYDRFPHYNEISFSDRAEVETRLARFIGDPSARQQVVRDQRLFVNSHFTYRASVARMTKQMASLLEREPA